MTNEYVWDRISDQYSKVIVVNPWVVTAAVLDQKIDNFVWYRWGLAYVIRTPEANPRSYFTSSSGGRNEFGVATIAVIEACRGSWRSINWWSRQQRNGILNSVLDKAISYGEYAPNYTISDSILEALVWSGAHRTGPQTPPRRSVSRDTPSIWASPSNLGRFAPSILALPVTIGIHRSALI